MFSSCGSFQFVNGNLMHFYYFFCNQALRSGVFDVLPSNALEFLTAEDLRLLLNGVGDIHVGTLISYTTFNDESSESGDKLLKFKRWLWSIVEKMSNLERQDLVSFWIIEKKVWVTKRYVINKIHLIWKIAGLFLDRFASPTGLWGGLPAHAICYNSSCRRCSPAHGKHVHFSFVYSPIFEQSSTATQTLIGHQK